MRMDPGDQKSVPYPISDNSRDFARPKMADGGRSSSRRQECGAHGDGDSARRWTSAAHLRELLRSNLVVEWESSFSLRSKRRRRQVRGEAWRFRLVPGKPACVSSGRNRAGAEPDVVPGSQSVNRAVLVPGEDLSQFAYVNTTSHRNLYRISLP